MPAVVAPAQPLDSTVEGSTGGAVASGPVTTPGGACGYAHHQVVPSAEWVIPHGQPIPREPVLLLDSAPDVPVWADVRHTPGTTVLILPEPATGWAYV